MRGKSGISAIVATVLIILITIAAVTIIWGLVLPMLEQGEGFGTYNADVVIETDGGYTYFDSTKGVACVQVKRLSSDLNLTRIDVLFTYNGTTLSSKGNFSGDEIPQGNEMKQKCFDLSFVSYLGDRRYLAPDFITVVPIYFDGTKEVVGDVVATVTSNSRNSRGGLGSGSYPRDVDDLPTIGAIEITECDELFGGDIVTQRLNEAGKTYYLGRDVTQSDGGTCFVIDVSDVTLDFRGHTISGSGIDSMGILVGEFRYGVPENVVIKSTGERGIINGFSNGIIMHGDGYAIENIEVKLGTKEIINNNYGLHFYGGIGHRVQNVRIIGNFENSYGIYLEGSSELRFNDIFVDETGAGNILLEDASENIFDNLELSGFGLNGEIRLESSDGNNFSNVDIKLVSVAVFLYSSSDNNFIDVNITNARAGGISINEGSHRNIFTRITVNP